MNRKKEKGMALALTLLLLSLLTALAVSFMFLSQTETWSGMNYRRMSQARDGAEAGLNKVANFLMYSGYTPPVTGTVCASDVMGCYNVTTVGPVSGSATTPVQIAASGNPVGLTCSSASSSYGCSAPSNLTYPVSSVQTSYNGNGYAFGTITAGTTTVQYASYATLLSMQQVQQYGGTTATVQTWLITSDGTIPNATGGQAAQERLTAILEKPIGPAFGGGMFAVSDACGSLNFSGGTIESYDSSTYSGSGSLTSANGGLQASGANVGTNGNLTLNSQTTIDGTLSSPRTGVGTCAAGSPDACSPSNLCNTTHITGGIQPISQPATYPDPAPPYPAPPTTAQTLTGNNPCSGSGITTGCTANGTKIATLTQGSYGNLSVSGGVTIHLTPGNYSINSINLAGNCTLVIDPGGVVILNVAGSGTTTPVTLSGNMQSTSLDASKFEILYAGISPISLSGGSQSAGLVYAPEAPITIAGGSNWDGALIGSTITTTGSNVTINFDRHLASLSGYRTVGNYMLQSFNWKKF